MILDQLFKKLTGNPNANLWPFQKRVASRLLAGENVVLSAPTGSGKTWAALMSYLFSKQSGHPHVDKVIYALPLRTLATSLYESTIKMCALSFDLTDDLWTPRIKKELAVSIQTGEQQDDPFFLSDICFTTIDQVLSGYLNIPFSLPDRLANINAGTLLGALVVIDEIHLLEPDKSFWTLLEMVKRLQRYTQFLFMTATLSSQAIKLIADYLDAVVENVTPNELSIMPSHRDKHRIYRWVEKTLTAEQVINTHNGGRTIVICNTVKRAQEVYQDIKKLAPSHSKVMLLHSRFYSEDRRAKEDQLSDYFGPDATQNDIILVSTQVVEAGIDISGENLHTELCPANSLLQRAGRCARYADRNIGTVWVYELEQSETGKYKLGPYREKKSSENVARTRTAVIQRDGLTMDFPAEQELVNEVHESTEKNLITHMLANMKQRRDNVNSAIDNGGGDNARELIRDVNSVNVLFTDVPELIDLEKAPCLLSLPRTSLYSLEKVFSVTKPDKWIAKIPIYNQDLVQGGSYQWEELKTTADLSKISWLVAISPEAAAYSPEIGFQLGVKGKAIKVKFRNKPQVPSYSYNFEPYKEHARKVVTRTREHSELFGKASELLEKEMDFSKGFVSWMAELICALHDAGKLSEQWFSAVWAWQNDFYPDKISGPLSQPLAHCTYRPDKGDWHRQKSNKRYERGPHALEGAFSIANSLWHVILDKVNDPYKAQFLTQVAVTSIGRHHSARAENIREFKMIKNAVDVINESLEDCEFDSTFSNVDDCTSEKERIFFRDRVLLKTSDNEQYLPLYWLLIRRLRLADQMSLKE